MEMIGKISPSILACDFRRMGEEAAAMQAAGVDMIHLDVMDGHLVPNISFGVPVIESLKKSCSIFFDVHLMISDPLFFAEPFAKAGADLITFHIESDSDPLETIRAIRSLGKKVGISLKPRTPAEALNPYLELVDMVLVMTVEPGFGGQRFMEDMMPKVAAIRAVCDRLGLAADIQVDGGIGVATAPVVARHGANVLVAGSSLFGQPDYGEAVSALRAAWRSGVS